MSDFQSFRNAVLEDDDLQEAVVSIINTATANGSGMGDGIATLAKTHGYTISSDEVYAHQDFLGQGDDLTDFELELISGGQVGGQGGSS
ncbi:Nif11-like leader peptide family natural product precursor [Arenicellales bacterium nBUS_48]